MEKELNQNNQLEIDWECHSERSEESLPCHSERSGESPSCHSERSEESSSCHSERSEESSSCHSERSEESQLETIDSSPMAQNDKRDSSPMAQNDRSLAQNDLGLVKFIKTYMNLPDTDIKTYSPLTLAFIGDVIYDLVIRTIIVERGNAPVNKLHKKVSALVKAPAQMELFHKIEDKLTEEELGVYKRGRNAKSFTSAKNASITEYRIATGLEALVGYLYLTDQFARILELVKLGLEE